MWRLQLLRDDHYFARLHAGGSISVGALGAGRRQVRDPGGSRGR
jgi:hypothetical protein